MTIFIQSEQTQFSAQKYKIEIYIRKVQSSYHGATGTGKTFLAVEGLSSGTHNSWLRRKLLVSITKLSVT